MSEATPVQTTPEGVPQIPSGAQLGGQGTQQNQQQAVQQQAVQEQVVQPPVSPITANTLPQNNTQEQPVNPVQGQPEQPEQSTTEVGSENTKVYKNPYTPSTEESASYVETSIEHFVGELGITPEAFDSVIEHALEYNDLSLINVHALGKDLTPEQATRAKQLATAAVQEVQFGIEKAKTEVFALVGGEQAWQSQIQAFNANADEDIQGYAAYLADTGNFKKAAEFVVNFNRKGGFVNHQTQAPLQGGVGAVQSGLSKAEYATEIAKIELEAGNRSLGSPEFAARIADLDARRALGRQQGR